MVIVETEGPLFEGRIDVRRGVRDGAEAIAVEGVTVLRGILRRFRRGPERYGHIADAPVSQVKQLAADVIGTRIYLRGPAAFLGPILQGGARAHPIPNVRVRGSGSRRRLVGGMKPLAFMSHGGLLIRQAVFHPGIRSYHIREEGEQTLEPRVQPIFDAAMARQVDQ